MPETCPDERSAVAATNGEQRERIVVALPGGPAGETLIRAAADVAMRTPGAELLAVHVTHSASSAGSGLAALESQRALVESLGGTYHAVVGESIARALVDFAKSVEATRIVVGSGRRVRWHLGDRRDVAAAVAAAAGAIDVQLVGHTAASRSLSLPPLGRGLTARRQVAGMLTAAALLGLTTPVMAHYRGRLAFPSDVSLYLLFVVITSIVGGFYPALLAAVAGSLLLNYFFVDPIHTFTIARGDNILALVIFLLVAVLVSRVVDLSARRSTLAARASAEAETLSTLAGSLLRGEHALPALLARVREAFAMQSVSLLSRDASAPGRWQVLATVGDGPPQRPEDADCTADIDSTQLLALRGHVLPAEDQRVLSALAAQVAMAYRHRELASVIEPLAESDRARTALLNAVSHDLRTPIASAKAAVSGLRADDVAWSDDDRAELLGAADTALDRLTDLVTNLLDLSRLQAGVLPIRCAPVGLDDVVARALDHVAGPGAHIEVAVPPDLPAVSVDAGLLERVIANLVQNALRYTPSGVPVRVTGSEEDGRVTLRVVDHGPGIAPAASEAVFAPFQRRDDAPSSGNGVGLGLAIARGFTEAMGGSVVAEQTPGGGATLVVSLVEADAS
jgi:two-component system, OmpR family, sensor histidine kinase KdpD